MLNIDIEVGKDVHEDDQIHVLGLRHADNDNAVPTLDDFNDDTVNAINVNEIGHIMRRTIIENEVR